MSFGFGIGDFVTIINLANQVRKDFAGAPKQYQTIAAEVKTFSLVLQDIDTYLSAHSISPSDGARLDDLIISSFKTLKDIENTIAKFSSLEAHASGFRERTRRVWQRVKWEPEEFRDFRSRIVSTITLLNTFVNGFDRKDVAILVSHTSKLVDEGRRQADQEILNWIAPADYTAQHDIHKHHRLPGTGEWLLESDTFKRWVNLPGCANANNVPDQTTVKKGSEQSGVLLLHGIPGAGKTILSSICVDYLQQIQNPENDIGISYYYCEYSRQQEQKAESILASLLRQLAQTMPSDMSTSLTDLFSSHHKIGTHPTLKEVLQLLRSVISTFQTTYMIIDALDECQSLDDTRRIIISELLELSKSTTTRILFTSRLLPDISNFFRNHESFEVRASDQDIAKYVASKVPSLPSFVGRSPSLQDEILRAIVSSADGVFLLATLHTQALQGSRSSRAIRTALESFTKGSSGYKEAYSNTMNRILSQVEDQKTLAIDALMWTVYAERSLTSDELVHALATIVGDEIFYEDNISDIEDILSACCGLLVVESETKLLRVVHRTTQEYLKENRSIWFHDVQTKMSNVCNTYLAYVDSFMKANNGSFEPIDQLHRFPFFNYASWHGLEHARMREHPMTIEEVVVMQDHFGNHSQSVQDDTVSQYLDLALQNPGITGLHLLAYHGASKLIPNFLTRYDVNAVDKVRWTPIFYAVMRNHLETVQLLIQHGAQLNITNENGCFPLHLIAENYDVDVGPQLATVLVDHGADPNSVDGSGRTVLSRAVKVADDLIYRLLELGCDPFLADNDGCTPICHAAAWRLSFEKPVNVLLEHVCAPFTYGASHPRFIPPEFKSRIHKPDNNGCTPIIYAARSGITLQENVNVLLDYGADINSCDANHRSVLSWVTRTGDLALIERLVKEGARVDDEDVDGMTPLSYAACLVDDGRLKFLLDNGAQIDHPDNVGYTALFYAASSGQVSLVQLLLSHGAEINHLDNSGYSVVLRATEAGHANIIKILVKGGANVETVDDMGRNAIHIAAMMGELEAFDCLLAAGADIKARDKRGMSTLEYASLSGVEEMVKKILNSPQWNDLTNPNSSSWNALHWACMHGTFEMLTSLVGSGIKATIVETEQPAVKWTPLDVAVYCKNENLVTSEGTMKQEFDWSVLVASGLVLSDLHSKTTSMFRMNDLGPGRRNTRFVCDGCESAEPEGLQFDCKDCENFDLCMFCKHDSEYLHPGHRWEAIEPKDNDNDKDNDDHENKAVLKD